MVSVEETSVEEARGPSGLRRDVGLIGLMWASVGSIIGSGWLYGAHDAVIQAGPAAIISWVIGAVAIVLLALAHTNSAATWWKIAVPLGAIFIMAALHFHPANFHSEGFAPFGAKGVLAAISTSGIIFALLGFEQAIQLAGESRNPKRDLPRA